MKNVLVVMLLFFVLVFAGCNKQTSVVQNNNKTEVVPEALNVNSKALNAYPTSSADQVAEKLEVYYFHRTARCYSCQRIGQYTKETMEQKYSKQIDDGVIDFRELNVELSENKEVATKFQASGSSLFINRIIDGQDNIEQDTNVWRLLGDEVKFKRYLENKINSNLGI